VFGGMPSPAVMATQVDIIASERVAVRARLDDARGRREPRPDRPRRDVDDDERRAPAAAPAPTERVYSSPRKASQDPFFDRPYEASYGDAASWEAQSASTAPAARGLSPNIKQKRRVAALFGMPKATEPSE
jgi:hypothetical protein